MKCTFLGLGGLIGIIVFVSCAQARQPADQLSKYEQMMVEREHHAGIEAYIATTGASAPIGRFLLVRRGEDVCAVRFTRMYRGNDAHSPSVFSSGDESLYADYEWYRPHSGSDFSSLQLESGHGQVSSTAMVGLWRFAFGGGNRTVYCGPLPLRWIYPNNLGFRFMTDPPKEYEMAPTKWQDVREVNPQDQRLKWYRYDESRLNVYIPIDALW